MDPFKDRKKHTPRALADKFKGLLRKLLQEAETEAEIIEKLTVACVRSTLNKVLKQYIDAMEITTLQRYIIKINEWVDCRAEGKPIYQHKLRQKQELRDTKDGSFKKKVTCYHCGKLGHVSRECRSRLASERQTVAPIQPKEVLATPGVTTTGRPDRKTVVCFTCHQKGHKSPQCPQKVTSVKRIQIPMNKVVPLKHNELFCTIEGHTLPITCDSRADITVVPEECVSSDQFTGEMCTVDTFNKVKTVGKKCNVKVQVDDRVFIREAVTQPGDDISWTACLSISFSDIDDLQFIMDQMRMKKSLDEEQLCYLPPRMEKGVL